MLYLRYPMYNIIGILGYICMSLKKKIVCLDFGKCWGCCTKLCCCLCETLGVLCILNKMGYFYFNVNRCSIWRGRFLNVSNDFREGESSC